MTSVPLHAPCEVRRSRTIAAQYDRTHLQLKIEVAQNDAILAQMEAKLGSIIERAVKRSRRSL